MQGFWQHIWRTEEDDSRVWLTRWQDWAIALAFLLVSIYLLRNRQSLSRDFVYSTSRALVVLLILQNLSRYIFNRKHYPFDMRYPLYSCNVSGIILAVSFFVPFNSQAWNSLVMWAAFSGLYGGFFAILMAKPSNFKFPHMANLDYYIGHICICFLGLRHILYYPEFLTTAMLRDTTLITLFYLAIVYKINPLLGTNYGFTNYVPEPLIVLQKIPFKVYRVLLVIGYSLANALTYLAGKILT